MSLSGPIMKLTRNPGRFSSGTELQRKVTLKVWIFVACMATTRNQNWSEWKEIALVSFSHGCDQIPDRNKSKGRIIYFISWFQRIQSIVTWIHVSGPVVKQFIMMAGMCGRSCPHCGQEAEGNTNRKEPETYLLKPGSTHSSTTSQYSVYI
jgi:hypothetical protein